MRIRLLPPAVLLPAACAALLAVAGCASTPADRFHTLMASELAPRSAAARAPIAIVLEPIRLLASVDQPQWLVRLPDDSVALLEQERWASPLRDEFRQALLEVLVVRHAAVDARTLPSGRGALRVGVDLRRFESVPSREARIEGSWTIVASGPTAPVLHCEIVIREAAAGGPPTVAAAHRRALARLADAIGVALGAIADGQRAGCPTSDPRG